MEFLLYALSFISGGLVVYLYPRLIGGKRKPMSLLNPPRKRSEKFESYTLEELYAHKNHLEASFKRHVNYPELRKYDVQDLKLVLADIDILEMESGIYALNQKKADHKKELDAYDRIMKELS